MSVVNVKVSHIRPKYKNLEEWVKDKTNVYIGRSGVVFINGKKFPEEPSIFANPFKISNKDSRDDVIRKYKKYILDKINILVEYREEFNKLKGKNLGCWCAPEKCHGDVLLFLLKNYDCYEYFDDECNICSINCNELDGWKCGFCKKVYCNEHNMEDYTCKCEEEFIRK